LDQRSTKSEIFETGIKVIDVLVPLERGGPWTVERIYQLFPRLAERKLNRGRQLSGGEQEMLSIARALLLNPKLLILDEPSQGLAPLIVREVFRIVQQMKAEGISVLLVEQNARMSLEIADDAYVLDDGVVVYSGLARELAADGRSTHPEDRDVPDVAVGRRERRGLNDLPGVTHLQRQVLDLGQHLAGVSLLDRLDALDHRCVHYFASRTIFSPASSSGASSACDLVSA